MNGYLHEILQQYQVRRSRKQKDAFIAYAKSAAEKAGYSLREEPLGSRPSRNLIAGDPERAQVLFTAHYDTCAEMPFPNLIYPQNRLLSILAQMPLVLLILGISLGAAAWAETWGGRTAAFAVSYTLYFALFLLIYFGPGNPHTANDNTSGVAALMEIMAALPAEQKPDVCFIFFDHEEYGKVGSKAYAKAHPGITEGKILMNLDCVGDGDDFLIVAPKQADGAMECLLREAFQDAEGKRAVHCSARNTRYNSDQLSFSNGIAAAACRKGKLGYHIPRIHTRRDVICEESNLQYITACCLRLAAQALSP